MRVRKESVITYLFMIVLIGAGVTLLYLLQGGFTGFAVYEGPGEGQTTLMLQVADSENLGDVFADGGVANKNRGIDTDLKVQRNPYQRIYIKFNISGVPSGQIIDGSQLCLYLYNDQGTQTIFASHVYIHNWNEGTEDNVDVSGQDYTTNLTWNNQPCGVDFNNDINCNLTAESSISNDGTFDETWQCWNVTNAVSSEYDVGDNNVSIVLYTEDLGNPDIFYSKEYTGDESLRPYLNITYHTANTAPTINLVEPQAQLYLSTENLNLNYSVSDGDDNLDSCWYNLDYGANTTLVDCANATFGTSEGSHTLNIYANDSLGLQSMDSVSFDVDITGVSVDIVEPTGAKTSRTGISIEYSVIGDDLTCWYNVKTSIGGSVIENTTLEGCSDSSFDVAGDGDYVLNLFVNNSFGSIDSDSSSFNVDTSTSTTVIVPSSGGGGGGGTTIITPKNLGLTLYNISNLIANPGESKKISLPVKNTGTTFLNSCKFKSIGGFASWISYTETKDLAAGEEYEFIFDLNVPEDIEARSYTLDLSVECQEITESTNFVVEVIEKKFSFNLIKVERTSKEEVKIIYSIEELSGLEQNIELQFLLFDVNNNKLAETKDSQIVSMNSKSEFEILMPIDSSLEGEMSLLINLNSETYSTFVQEAIILGAPVTGLAIFGEAGTTDNLISLIIIILFLIFAFFIIRRILKHRKKK